MYVQHKERTPFYLRWLGWPTCRMWVVQYLNGRAYSGWVYFQEER